MELGQETWALLPPALCVSLHDPFPVPGLRCPTLSVHTG